MIDEEALKDLTRAALLHDGGWFVTALHPHSSLESDGDCGQGQ